MNFFNGSSQYVMICSPGQVLAANSFTLQPYGIDGTVGDEPVPDAGVGVLAFSLPDVTPHTAPCSVSLLCTVS